MYNVSQRFVDEREIYRIRHYDSYNYGYNMTYGGASNANRISKTYTLFDGTVPMTIHNLYEWCRNNGVKYMSMKSLFYSKYYRECGQYNNGKPVGKKTSGFTVYDKDNNIVHIDSIASWCRENNFNYGVAKELFYSKNYREYKGFHNKII